MRSRLDRGETIVRAIVHECKVERITFMAGSIAYNAFASLLPLLFLLLALVSAVGDQQLEATMISLTQAIVTPGAGEVIVEELQQSSVGASLVGVVVLVWGMLRIFRSLDMAFSNIYETETRNTLMNQVTDGIIVFGSMAAVIIGVVVAESSFSLSGGSGLSWIAQRGFMIVLVMIALTPMYYLFPDESGMSVIEVVPGVGVTASMLVVSQSVFSVYIEYSSQTAENQMLASILIFLTWLYFIGLVVLLGAAINAVLSNRSEDVNIDPLVGGVPRVDDGDGETLETSIPEGILHQLNHSLSTAREITIVVDGDETYTMPAPESATVDTDTSLLPGINDTASITFNWTRSGATETAEMTVETRKTSDA